MGAPGQLRTGPHNRGAGKTEKANIYMSSSDSESNVQALVVVAAPARGSPLREVSPGEQTWRAIARVLRCLDAVRDGRIWYVLLSTFAASGLLLAMAQSAFAKEQNAWGAVQGGLALFTAFYGANAAGWLTMQSARGLDDATVDQALRTALTRAHRLLLMLPLLLALAALLGGVLALLLWACRLPVVGPLVYTLVVPLGVVAVGGAALAATAVLIPLSAPAIWAGLTSWQTLRWLVRVVRQRLAMAAILVSALSLVVGLVGGLVTFIVVMGGQVFTAASSLMGMEVPREIMLAGLFGYGLRGLQIKNMPPELLPYSHAALIGGGVVFALALVLPALVYLRGVAEVHLILGDSLDGRPADGSAS